MLFVDYVVLNLLYLDFVDVDVLVVVLLVLILNRSTYIST